MLWMELGERDLRGSFSMTEYAMTWERKRRRQRRRRSNRISNASLVESRTTKIPISAYSAPHTAKLRPHQGVSETVWLVVLVSPYSCSPEIVAIN